MLSKPLKVAFIHPDLGIGGAERLVVDAAVGLQSKGHDIVIYTSHHDRSHCFQETKDGTLDVRVRGNTIIPSTFFGYFYIVSAILRQLHLSLSLIFTDKDQYDVIFVDQLSACIPLLKLTGAKVLFYCHFPDKLLSIRESLLKSIYRYPIDKLEELTTGMADSIVVNSRFTSLVFQESFPTIKNIPQILYPGIHFDSYDKEINLQDKNIKILETSKELILSINRFERKKNISLAINAFANLKDSLPSKNLFLNLQLVIAGGYDLRVKENVEYHLELNEVANQLDLETFTIMPGSTSHPPDNAQIIFLCSFNEAQRTYLLSKALCLLYTPSNEHFGIVPIEAMYSCLPVIAVNNGGPKETIRNQETGFLCEATPEAFSEALSSIILNKYNRYDLEKSAFRPCNDGSNFCFLCTDASKGSVDLQK
ncbi:8838_t:CDS:2 [Entrophospora sp. SA101]|nr:8838_t:CDS:2 [Entrophospora sp. SA101]